MMINNKQCSIWNLAFSPARWISNDNNQQREQCTQSTQTGSSKSCYGCSRSILLGFLLGSLLAGIALSSILTLFLQKQVTITMTTTTTTTIITTPTTITTSKTTTTTTSTSTSTTTTSALNINLIKNGDAENGSCATSEDIHSPSGWSFSGPISQVCYSNNVNTSAFIDQSFTTLGPSNRGQNYFFGHRSASTSMWQTVDFSSQINPFLIDNQTVRFNFSAWIGGLNVQDDNVVIYLTFGDANNQMQGNTTSLGPVTANDRSSASSLIFLQASGIVPVGVRFLTVLVTMTRDSGSQNNGDVDNISVVLYQ